VRILFPSSRVILTTLGLITVLGGSLHAAPVIPGLEHKHPLTEAQKGAVLIEELRCASCHEGMPGAQKATGPDLREVGSRIQPHFLKKFIQNPALHDPGTKMPDVMGNRSEEEKAKIATEISAYLLSLKKSEDKPAPLPMEKAEEGKKLFHEVGCVVCHGPKDGNADVKNLTGYVGLSHVSKKYHPTGLADFLHEPLKVRPDGRMPDMRLSRSEAELLSAFLIGSEAAASKAETHTPEMIAAGKKAFEAMSCNACHNVDSIPKPTLLPPKAKLSLNGCISENTGKAPNYQLNDIQRKAIRAALTEMSKKPTAAESINMRLTQLNCISCHQRDEFGGVKPELDSYFHSTEEALGNESRIPPPLTLVGAKLRPEWLNKVLYEGQAVRPYMTTRMPQYGNHALDGLQQFFGETDKLEPFDYAEIKKESAPMMRDEGHRLIGDQGLSCISCHNYNGIDSPSMKGLDLMTSYQRLQPAWFDQFMKNPAKFRPGIIMPSFWPDGKAVQTEILDGNTDAQLQALWHQFSLGRSARDPSGLRAADPELIVTDQVRTYRGRSTVAGYRGIAVGFPGGMNYAFNAHNGSLSAFWTGKFVNVGWRGQGSGNFTPAAPAIQLAEDVAFLTEFPETWPLKPIRTKEIPVNPDPTYPSQHSYSFKGYSIGEKGVPTFRYNCGEIAIEDTSVTGAEKGKLNRTLTFTSKKAMTIYFRAMSGSIEPISESSFKIPKLQLNLEKSNAKFSNILRDVGEKKELILKLDLPAGTSTLALVYVLQP